LALQAREPAVTIELFHDANTPRLFELVFRQLSRLKDVESSVSVLRRVFLPTSEDSTGNSVNTKATERLANASIALLRLTRDDNGEVRRVISAGGDPTARSYLIHRMSRYGVEPATLFALLKHEADPLARQALMLALGQYDVHELRMLHTDVNAWSREDADPGIHGAAEWLLHKLGKETELHMMAATSARWYATSEGHTMVIIRPQDELGGAEKVGSDTPTITWPYAIASKCTRR
jgi:hypothetical protein